MTAPTIPTTAAELEEMLHDSGRMADVYKDPTALKEFIGAYARKTMHEGTELRQQVKEEVQKGLADFLRDNEAEGLVRPDLAPWNAAQHGLAAKMPQNTVHNPQALGARLDKEFAGRGLGDYLKTIWHQNPDPAAREKQARIRNAFGSEVPADGGFLVPEILRANLLSVALEQAVVRPRAMVVPMDSARVPFPTVDSTTNVGSQFGGITTYWTEEGAALTASSATFGRVVLDAKKLTAYCEVPTELVADSVMAFESFINQKFPLAIAFSEDVKFMSGTGTGEPLGFISSPAAISVAKQTGQATGTIVWENLVGMFARMLPSALSSAVWIASIDTFPQLATMALSVGTGGSAVWIGNLQQPGSAAPPITILGRPVYFTEKTSKLSTTGDINFVDLSYYLIGDRQQLTAASSQDYKFGNDLTAFRFTQRLDGRPWIASAITPANGGPALSPFVQLATR